MPLGWPSRRPPSRAAARIAAGVGRPISGVSRTRPKASGRSRPRSASAMRRSLAAGRSLPPSTWSGRCLGASAPPLRPSRSAPSRRPHPRRQATCRRAIRARRPSNGDIPRRQPSQPPSSCSKVSRLIPIGARLFQRFPSGKRFLSARGTAVFPFGKHRGAALAVRVASSGKHPSAICLLELICMASMNMISATA